MHFLGGNERESQSTQGNLHNHTGKYANGFTVQIIIWSKKPNSIMRTGCTDTFAKTNLTSNIGSILFLSAEMMWKEPVPLEHSPCCFHSKINHLDSHVLPCFVLFFFFLSFDFWECDIIFDKNWKSCTYHFRCEITHLTHQACVLWELKASGMLPACQSSFISPKSSPIVLKRNLVLNASLPHVL